MVWLKQYALSRISAVGLLAVARFSRKYSSKQGKYAVINETNGVRKITLSHPQSRNALSLAMMMDVLEGLSSGDLNSLRCIVIDAEGPVFSSGHNLKELILDGKNRNKEVFSVCTSLMEKIMKLDIPVIAAVQGPAVAAGCQLVAQCDIAICSDNCVFSTPGSHFGVFCSTPGIPLARTVPRKLAAYMLMTGKSIAAQDALQAGLVSKVVPRDKLREETMKICDTIKSQSRSVVAHGKKFFYQQLELSIMSAYKLGEDIMNENIQFLDGQEGIKSFAEKRKPVWSHTFEKVKIE